MICLDETENFYLKKELRFSVYKFQNLENISTIYFLLVSDCLGGFFILRGRAAFGKLIMQ
jgi:hypothetical protein